ncbi:MAG: stage II sporulation protein P [Defluviitaleaceae bacterium]|nr:stage II sporulation protein P [Defluviitaleaceae bacterium]
MSKKRALQARGILAMLLLFGAVILLVADDGQKVLNENMSFAEPREKNVYAASVIIPTRLEMPVMRRQFTPPGEAHILRLEDFNYLTRNIFLADRNTILFESDINVREFLAKDFVIDTAVEGPLVLIFHAHSREMFYDSDPYDPMTGVMGAGRELAEILSRDYGIEVLHHTERFDILDGLPMREGAYERLEPVIRQILADNPSIQVVIDLHRDGVGPHVAPLVTYINGERAAQIMFVNGLSRRYRYRTGEILPADWLPNPYQRENLAFTLHLQLAANELHPDFARRAYLLPFRYSLHMLPASILLEVGAQNNTFQEALNAMPAMAEIIAAVILE